MKAADLVEGKQYIIKFRKNNEKKHGYYSRGYKHPLQEGIGTLVKIKAKPINYEMHHKFIIDGKTIYVSSVNVRKVYDPPVVVKRTPEQMELLKKIKNIDHSEREALLRKCQDLLELFNVKSNYDAECSQLMIEYTEVAEFILSLETLLVKDILLDA